ncbi:MAG: hypothetical protein U0324_22370 [Polyangiales bacterium]
MDPAALPAAPELRPDAPWIAPSAPDDPQFLHRAAAIASDGTVYVAAGSLLHELAPDGLARDTRRLPWALPHRGSVTLAGPRLVVWGAGRTLVLDREGFVVRVREDNAVAALSASGRLLALGPFTLRSEVRLAVFDVPDAGPLGRPYPPPAPSGGHPLWVGEDRDLLFAFGGAHLYRHARDVTEAICAGGAGEFTASSDGATLAYATHSQAAFHAVAERRSRGVFKQARWSIALGPGGRIAVRDTRGRVVRFTPESGERRLLGALPGREGTLCYAPEGDRLVACASDEPRVAVFADDDASSAR